MFSIENENIFDMGSCEHNSKFQNNYTSTYLHESVIR